MLTRSAYSGNAKFVRFAVSRKPGFHMFRKLAGRSIPRTYCGFYSAARALLIGTITVIPIAATVLSIVCGFR